MDNAKLGAIAQRLRSDSQNERMIAARKVEAATGMSLVEIIRKGARVAGMQSSQILDHLTISDQDELILAVGVELQKARSDWGELVLAGSRSVNATAEAFTKVFGEAFAQPPWGKKAERPDHAGRLRMTLENITPYGIGVPDVGMVTLRKNNFLYASVKFDEIEYAGQVYVPSFPIFATGQEWVRKLVEAQSQNLAVLFAMIHTDNHGNVIITGLK